MRTISNGSAVRSHLFDIQTVEGTLFYWADRALSAPAVITTSGNHQQAAYQPWIMVPPTFTFHRSMTSDTGSFTVQNVSGDTLARDFERIVRGSAMEGALFVYRYWNAAAEVADIEVHGTLSVPNVGTSTAEPSCTQLFTASADDAPAGVYSETCQLVWAEKRCGAPRFVDGVAQPECLYSYKTCQVPERFTGILNSFQKNYGEAVPNVPANPTNRRRTI